MVQKKVSRSLDIDPEELERVEALVPAMVEDPMVRAAGRVTAARVLRYALVEGLAILESRYGVAEAVCDDGLTG